jgi:cell division protein FtsW
MLFMLCMALLFIGRVPFGKLFTMGAGGIAMGALAVLVHVTFPDLGLLPRYDTWKNRLTNRMESDSQDVKTAQANAQAKNAQLAIHVGALFGQGVGDGKLKEYLPEAYADFYFATFVEEFGFLMAAFLALLYLILLYRIIKIALKTNDPFQSYVSLGIGIHLLTQASINMLVCTGVFPVTGQNMPFLAMGGSALIMACVSIGVIQAFAKDLEKDKDAASFAEA